MSAPSSATSSPPDIVLAPRTPTPPPTNTTAQTPSTPTGAATHGRQHSYGLGIGGTLSSHSRSDSHSTLRHSPSHSSLFFEARSSGSPKTMSPVKMLSPDSAIEDPPLTASTAYFSPSLSENAVTDDNSPFNFQPMSMAKSPIIKSNISARRGHKYKHSSSHHSMSMTNSLIAEPPPRPALSLPASLPIPTFSECRASMTPDQKIRLGWSMIHMLVAGHVAWNAHSSAAVEALSHLIFYDSLGAMLCVFVEVWHNFDVWGRSSIRHPFGLQRIEVIAGFALSVLLIFFGFDLISHNAKHALEGLGSHTPHVAHSHHDRVTAGAVDFTVLLALASTLISAVGLKNHARIGKAMRFAAMENLPFSNNSILTNPSHFLTLSCSTLMLLLPLLDLHTYEIIDKLLSLSIALAMLFLGVMLGKNVGSMLLMSHPGTGVNDVIFDIETDPLVRKVEVARFWQAHYGLGMANLRLRVAPGTSSEDGALVRLRERIVGVIRNRLSGGYGAAGAGSGQKWEVSVEFQVDDHDGAHARVAGHDGHVGCSGASHGHSHGHVHVHGMH